MLSSYEGRVDPCASNAYSRPTLAHLKVISRQRMPPQAVCFVSISGSDSAFCGMVSRGGFNCVTFSASPTPTAVFSFPGIDLIKRVTCLAVGFLCVPSRDAGSAHYVHLLSNCFKMIRINARGVSAEVVDNKTIWNWSFVNLIGHPVRRLNNALSAQSSVSKSIRVCGPYPTGRRFFDFSKESFLFRWSHMEECIYSVAAGVHV